MSKISKIQRYWAAWCQPCHAFEKTFNKVAENEKYKDIKFESVDVESDEGTADSEKYGIRSIPTTIFFDKDDKEIARLVGNVLESKVIETIDANE